MIIIDNKKPTISNYSKFHGQIKTTSEYTKFADRQIKTYKTEIRSGTAKQALIPTPFTPVENRMLRCMLIIRSTYLLKKQIDKIDLKMDEELFGFKLDNSLNSEHFNGLEFYDQKLENKKCEKIDKRSIAFLNKQSLRLRDDITKAQLKLEKVENKLKKSFGTNIFKNIIDGQN